MNLGKLEEALRDALNRQIAEEEAAGIFCDRNYILDHQEADDCFWADVPATQRIFSGHTRALGCPTCAARPA